MVALLTLTFSIPVCAADTANNVPAATANTTSGSMLLDDKAGLLKGNEAQQVLEALEVASSKSNCNIVVATTNQGLSESAIQSYADNYYATNVENKSQTNFCVTLTVDISSRKVDVGTYNPGSKRNLNDAAKDEIREYVTSDLSNGNYAKAFTKFDEWLGVFKERMNEDDLVIITADHGCDPGTKSTDHSREYTPLIVFSKHINPVNLGIRATFADIGKTITHNFNIGTDLPGKSFLKEIKEWNNN